MLIIIIILYDLIATVLCWRLSPPSSILYTLAPRFRRWPINWDMHGNRRIIRFTYSQSKCFVTPNKLKNNTIITILFQKNTQYSAKCLVKVTESKSNLVQCK